MTMSLTPRRDAVQKMIDQARATLEKEVAEGDPQNGPVCRLQLVMVPALLEWMSLEQDHGHDEQVVMGSFYQVMATMLMTFIGSTGGDHENPANFKIATDALCRALESIKDSGHYHMQEVSFDAADVVSGRA